MADKEYLVFGVLFTHDIEKGLEVFNVIVKIIDFDAFAVRAAVSPVVEGVDGIAFRNEVVDHVAIAPAVLGEAVRD